VEEDDGTDGNQGRPLQFQFNDRFSHKKQDTINKKLISDEKRNKILDGDEINEDDLITKPVIISVANLLYM